MTDRKIRVFRVCRSVPSRIYGNPRKHCCELIARGTGTKMYASKHCTTQGEAEKLCLRYLSRNPNLVDTTQSPGTEAGLRLGDTKTCAACGGEGWGDGSAEIRRDANKGSTTCVACGGTGQVNNPAT